MSNHLFGVHWVPLHRSASDKDTFAAWNPPFVKIVWSGDSVPYLSDVPPAAKIVVRSYEISENYGNRGLAPRVSAGHEPGTGLADWQNGSGRDAVDLPTMPNVGLPVRQAAASVSNDPEAVAAQHAGVCAALADKAVSQGANRDRLIFEGLNEPMVWSTEPPVAVAQYYRAFTLALHSYGLHACVGNFGVGWPANSGPDTPVAWDFFKPVIAVMNAGDYLGLHEYWGSNGVTNEMNGQRNMWGWWAGRYQKCPFAVNILITECGIDMGVMGASYAKQGWMNLPGTSLDAKAQRYIGELGWYEDKARADGRIRGLFPYTYDGNRDDWGMFALDVPAFLTPWLPWLASRPPLPATPPNPPPAQPPTSAPSGEVFRSAAWSRQNIPYNPATALYREARRRNLGAPLSGEYEVGDYISQNYASGILSVKKGGAWNEFVLTPW